MRFMMIVKASRESEAGVMPDEALIAAMTRYNEELARAGVLLDLSGLHPSSKGARIKFSGGKATVIDGPFAETKELIAGYWLIQVKSREEAIEWAKRVPAPHGEGREGEIELRQLFELEDFTPSAAIDRARELEKSLAERRPGRRRSMGARSEALAQQFEAKAREAAAVIEKLTDADWKKVTQAERWSVGVTAHHLAGALEPVAGMITALAAGQAPGAFSVKMLDELNARHAAEHADCTREETIALHRRGAAAAAAVVQGLSDDQLGRSGTVFTDAPPMTVEQLVARGLIGHIDEHVGSIRRTIGP
jgi:hypothetical protein